MIHKSKYMLHISHNHSQINAKRNQFGSNSTESNKINKYKSSTCADIYNIII